MLALEIIEMLEDKQQSLGLVWDIFIMLTNLVPLGICIFNLTQAQQTGRIFFKLL